MSCNSKKSPGMKQKCTEVRTEWLGMNKMSRNDQLGPQMTKCPGLSAHCPGLREPDNVQDYGQIVQD